MQADDIIAQQDEESTAAILKAIHRDLDDRDEKLRTMEAAMKQRNYEIDRKSAEIESLTKKFDAIVAAQGGQEQQHAGMLGLWGYTCRLHELSAKVVWGLEWRVMCYRAS